MAEPMKCGVCDRPLALAEPRYVHADGNTYRHPIRPVAADDAEQAARPAGDEPEWRDVRKIRGGIERAMAKVPYANADTDRPVHEFWRGYRRAAQEVLDLLAAHVGQRGGGTAGDDTGRHITQEMVAELDRAAGKTHSADGGVMSTLRRLIDLYETSGAAAAPRAGADTEQINRDRELSDFRAALAQRDRELRAALTELHEIRSGMRCPRCPSKPYPCDTCGQPWGHCASDCQDPTEAHPAIDSVPRAPVELPDPEQVAREAEQYALDAAGYDVSIRDAWRDGYAAAEERWNAAANESARLDVLDNNRLRDRVAELERALAEHEQARTLGGPVTGKRVPTPPGAWTNADSAAPVQADYTGSVDETGDQT